MGKPGGPGEGGGLTGIVIKGRVGGGTVQAFRLNGRERSSEVARTTTGGDGSFSLAVGASEGPFLLVATEGSFTDEATGSTIQLNGDELTALVPSFSVGGKTSGVLITPMSHFAAILALRYMGEGAALADANAEAWQSINTLFGNVDWRKTVPMDLTSATGTQLDGPATAGLILAGLSAEARMMAEDVGVTPGGAVNSLSLVEALADDLRADGYFDGIGSAGQLSLPPGNVPKAQKLNSQTVRFGLAKGITKFLQSERNTYSLKVADVQSLVRDLSRAANSRIFRTGGTDFDNEPPSVVLTASFQGAKGMRDAVGGQRLVRGVVTVTADALDASDVRSLSLAVGESSLVPVPQGNTVTHFAGTWDPKGEGALTIVATASDAVGNTGKTELVVLIDNTKPQVSVVAPEPGFYSGGVRLEASATDANGVASLAVGTLPGLVDADTEVTHFVGTWDIPAEVADGPVKADFVACDLVDNCETVSRPLTVDRTPPSIDVQQAPPQFSQASATSFSVKATDSGAGVTGVYVRSSGATLVGRDTGADTWTFDNVPLVAGPNSLEVWGVDAARGAPNSGQGKSAPHLRLVSVLQDSVAPKPVVDAFPSYFPEDGMRIADMTPPGRYAYGSPGKVPIINQVSINKAWTRLSWDGQRPTSQELEGDNPRNLPFVRILVPSQAGVEAPIASARFHIVARCSGGCGDFVSDGDLIPSHSSDASSQYFLLPLTSETVPLLTVLPANQSAALIIETVVTDAAGNTSVAAGLGLEFRLVGPPLQLVEDGAYPSYADPRSIFVFPMGGGTYARLFDPGNASVNGGVRVARYVLRNPSPKPVLATFSTGGSWRLIEDWDDDLNVPPEGAWDANGVHYAANIDYSQRPANWCNGAPPMNPLFLRSRYVTNFNANPGEPFRTGEGACPGCSGDIGSEWPGHGRDMPPEVVVEAGGFSVEARVSGNEYQEAARSGDGAVIVPGASGAAPGEVVLYVRRPFWSARPRALNWQFSGTGQYRFENRLLEWWVFTGSTGSCCADMGGGWCVWRWAGKRWVETLVGAAEELNGSLGVWTWGTHAGNGNVSGATWSPAAANIQGRVQR